MAIFYFGSFQIGTSIPSEDPLEAVWSYIERASTKDFLKARCSMMDSLIDYAAVRLRQAVELRRASHSTTLLTKPLPLYYSALNLTRAALAVVSNASPAPAHGLRHVQSPDLLENGATVSQGTFRDYLAACGCAEIPTTPLRLRDCLSTIPEMGEHFIPSVETSRIVPIYVGYDGQLNLRFDTRFIDEADIEAKWSLLFPKLAGCCRFDLESSHLVVDRSVDTSSYEAIGRFCCDHLENRLSYGTEPLWYAIRQQPGETLLPRAAYYIAGLFTLSSIVRYQPEILEASDVSGSESAWQVSRFLHAAERFLPQLLYSWMTRTDTYFGGAA